MAVPVSRRVGLAALSVFFLLLAGLPLLRAVSMAQGLALFDAFYRSGALVFGGVVVIISTLGGIALAPAVA